MHLYIKAKNIILYNVSIIFIPLFTKFLTLNHENSLKIIHMLGYYLVNIMGCHTFILFILFSQKIIIYFI